MHETKFPTIAPDPEIQLCIVKYIDLRGLMHIEESLPPGYGHDLFFIFYYFLVI